MPPLLQQLNMDVTQYMAIVYENNIIQSGSDNSEADEDKQVPDRSEKDSEVKTGHSHQAQPHGPSHQAPSPSHQQAGSSHQSSRDHCGSSSLAN